MAAGKQNKLTIVIVGGALRPTRWCWDPKLMPLSPDGATTSRRWRRQVFSHAVVHPEGVQRRVSLASCLPLPRRSLLTERFVSSYDPVRPFRGSLIPTVADRRALQTIEDSYTTECNVDGADWTVEVLDTAGQEEYRGLWEEQTVSQGQAFIITYDISSRRSFDALPSYIHTIRRCKHEDDHPPDTLTPRNTPFIFALAANKCDLPAEQREVSEKEGSELAKAGGGQVSFSIRCHTSWR